MRAVSDDQLAAMSIGISVPKVFGLAWAMAGLSAAAAGGNAVEIDHVGLHRGRDREIGTEAEPGEDAGDGERPSVAGPEEGHIGEDHAGPEHRGGPGAAPRWRRSLPAA